jgi:hypothetical protein
MLLRRPLTRSCKRRRNNEPLHACKSSVLLPRVQHNLDVSVSPSVKLSERFRCLGDRNTMRDNLARVGSPLHNHVPQHQVVAFVLIAP